MNNKKGQAALEFLTTYGWAFLVILVMIGALAYFGVLDPSRFLPNRCQFQTGVNCEKYVADSVTNSVTFKLKNGLPDHIFISDIQVYDANTGTFVSCNASSYAVTESDTTPFAAGGVSFTRGRVGDFRCILPNDVPELVQGDKVKTEIRFLYNNGNAYDDGYTTFLYGEVYMESN